MKVENIESIWSDKYPIKPANEMEMQELCNWVALCNALKFINNTSAVTGKIVNETDIVYKEMLTYIGAVSGDISTCLREADGVPFKYSLSGDSEESKQTDDLSYEFLDR